MTEAEYSANGYSIVEAEDMDAATALFTNHPHLANESIDVFEAYPIPGMRADPDS